jgi:hypothetical protein
MASRAAQFRFSGAERMRRSRERRREGLRCYLMEIRDDEVEALIERGCLAAEDREDAGAVVEALYRFLDGALT